MMKMRHIRQTAIGPEHIGTHQETHAPKDALSLRTPTRDHAAHRQSEAHKHERGGDDVDDMVPVQEDVGPPLDESRHMAAGRDAHLAIEDRSGARNTHRHAQVPGERAHTARKSEHLGGDGAHDQRVVRRLEDRRAERGQTQIEQDLRQRCRHPERAGEVQAHAERTQAENREQVASDAVGHGTGYGSRNRVHQGNDAEDQAGCTGVEATGILQVKGRHEFINTDGDEADEQTDDVHREMTVGKDRQVDQWMLDAALVQPEEHEHERARNERERGSGARVCPAS